MTVFIVEIEETLTEEEATTVLTEMEDVINRRSYNLYDSDAQIQDEGE